MLGDREIDSFIVLTAHPKQARKREREFSQLVERNVLPFSCHKWVDASETPCYPRYARAFADRAFCKKSPTPSDASGQGDQPGAHITATRIRNSDSCCALAKPALESLKSIGYRTQEEKHACSGANSLGFWDPGRAAKRFPRGQGFGERFACARRSAACTAPHGPRNGTTTQRRAEHRAPCSVSFRRPGPGRSRWPRESGPGRVVTRCFFGHRGPPRGPPAPAAGRKWSP